MKFKHLVSDEDESENGLFTDAQLIAENNWGPGTLSFFGKDSRAILIAGEITETLSTCIISQIFELASESEVDPIYIYISTDGGDITSGLAIYDAMRIVPCPIMTVVIGACHSAGLFILQGGDKRAATPHSSFFYHEPVSHSSGNTEVAITANADLYRILRENIDTILLKRSKMTKTVWKKDFAGKTAFYFTAIKALEYKLIDEIVEYSKPRPLKFLEE